MDSFPKEIEQKIDKRDPGKVVSFSLLYRAELDGFDVDTFHERCDGKGPTLTVLKGKGVTFGGYTSASWLSTVKQEVIIDDRSFLFCREEHKEAKTFIFEKDTKTTKQLTITRSKRFGPTFGGLWNTQYDLQVFRSPNEVKQDFKTRGKLLNGSIKFNSAYCNSDFKWQPNGGQLTVYDVLVYQVERLAKTTTYDDMQKEQIVKEIMDKMNPDVNGESMYNILLVGTVGSGKSSFCNTLTSAFQNRIERPAPTAASLTSVTSKYQGYQFSRDARKVSIRVFDTRGVESFDKYKAYLIQMLDGKLEEGSDIEDNPSMQEEDETAICASYSAMIHVVALVVDATKVEIYDKNMMAALNEIKKFFHEKGLKVVVIATHCDELDPLIKESPGQIVDNCHAKKCLDTIAGTIGLNKNMVIPFINYTNESENQDTIDKIALKAIKVLVEEANYYRAVIPRSTEKPRVTPSDVHNKLKKSPSKEGVTFLRILFVGKVGSGKSTFIDSVQSVVEQKRSNKAKGGFLDNEEEKDIPETKKVMNYRLKISSSAGAGTNACLVDMPGFSKTGSISIDKIKQTITGHVKNKCELEKEFSNTSGSSVQEPKLKDQIHVVCIVLDNESVSDKAPNWEVDMVKELLKWVRDKGIPYMTVLTKIDRIGTKLDEVLMTVEQRFLVNRLRIFPVQNYVRERMLDNTKNAALLAALNYMLENGLEYIDDYDDEDN